MGSGPDHDRSRLDGRVAIVTGAARGLGAAAAEALSRKGAHVLVADVLEKDGTAMAERLRDEGSQADFVGLDVTDWASWTVLVEQVTKRHGKLDCLVNNAGISGNESIEDTSLETFDRITKVNYVGPFYGMKAALPALKASGNASIINIASNTTDFILPNATAYGPSKAALANLTKIVAVHCARSGYKIRANSVHPGFCETPMTVGADGAIDSEGLAIFSRAIPMGRVGIPLEIGAAVAFLASDEASYITGSELFVDGGLTINSMG